MLGSRPSRQRNLVLSMVVARILHPASKLATARGLQEDTQFTSLGELLQVGGVDEDDFYMALDWLGAEQERIEQRLAKRHLADGCLVLYDPSLPSPSRSIGPSRASDSALRMRRVRYFVRTV